MSHSDTVLPGMKDITGERAEKTEFLPKLKRNKQNKNRQSMSHTCGICGKRFARPRNLVLHLRRHNQQKPFSCHLCQKSFARSDHLKNHVLRHLQKGNHPCNKCDKIFKRADHLRYHEVNEHGSTISLKELRTYSKTSTHGQSKDVQCEMCGKSFFDTKSLKIHSKIHSEGYKYECKYCGKSFNQRSNLNVHVRKHTGKKPYKCESCGESFITSSKLKTHARKHTGELPFVCDVCGKCFGESHLLKMHLRIHDNVRSYVCTDCGRSFTHSSTLQAHMRIHTGAKPYKCEVCQESFAQISSLIYHKRTHTGEKPFMCDICGNKYTRRTTLNTHRSRHTGDKLFSCSQCDFKCDIANQLRKHVLHYHVIANTPTSVHNLSENTDTVMHDYRAIGNQQMNASQFVISAPDEFLDNVTPYSKVQGNFSPNSFISLASTVQQPTNSNCVSSVRWTSSSDSITCKDPFSNLNSDLDSLPNLGNSSLQILTSGLTLQSSQPVISSFERPVKGEGNGPMALEPMIIPSLRSRRMPPELSHNNSLAHPSSIHESPMLTPTHPTFPGFSKICESDSMSSGTTIHPEIVSQLYNLSSKRKIFHDVQIPETMPEPTSIVSRLPNAKLNFQSLSTGPEANIKSAEALDQSQFALLSMDKPGQLDNGSEAIISNTSACQDNFDIDISLREGYHKISSEQDKINSGISSSSEERQISDIDNDKKDSSANVKNKVQTVSSLSLPSQSIQSIDVELKKEMSDEDNNKEVFEHASVCPPDTIGTKHFSRDTSKNAKQGFMNTASVFDGDNAVKTSGLKAETISTSQASENCRKTKQFEKSKAVDVSGNGSETTTLQNCQICGESFTCKSYLVTHMKLHCGDSLQCSICFREFSRSDHLNNHLLLHSRSRESKCFHCFEEFADPKMLEEHVQKMHNGTYPFRCKGCDFSCLEILQLKGHIWQMHSDHDYSCHVCHFTSKTSKDLKEHMKEHPDEGAFDCVQCGKSFSQKSVLKLHVMRKHSGEKLFACGICSEAFIAAAQLQRHLKHHTGDRPFTCEVCQKGFIDAKLLRIHSKIHSGEKPFQCNQCGCQFAHRSTLSTHFRIHTGVKPYKCDVCGDAFAQKSSLTGHQQIHDRQKMYTCHICGKSYTRMATLNIHLHQHAGRSRFSCQECDYNTNKASALKRHVEKWHRDKVM